MRNPGLALWTERLSQDGEGPGSRCGTMRDLEFRLVGSQETLASKSGLSLCLDSGIYKKSIDGVEITPEAKELEASSASVRSFLYAFLWKKT